MHVISDHTQFQNVCSGKIDFDIYSSIYMSLESMHKLGLVDECVVEITGVSDQVENSKKHLAVCRLIDVSTSKPHSPVMSRSLWFNCGGNLTQNMPKICLKVQNNFGT